MVTGAVMEAVGCVVALGALAAAGAAGAANTAGAPDAVPVSGCNRKTETQSYDHGVQRGANHRRGSHQQRGSASGCGKQQVLFVVSQDGANKPAGAKVRVQGGRPGRRRGDGQDAGF